MKRPPVRDASRRREALHPSTKRRDLLTAPTWATLNTGACAVPLALLLTPERPADRLAAELAGDVVHHLRQLRTDPPGDRAGQQFPAETEECADRHAFELVDLRAELLGQAGEDAVVGLRLGTQGLAVL